MKNLFKLFILLFICFTLFRCTNQSDKPLATVSITRSDSLKSALVKQLSDTGVSFPFSIALSPEKTNYYLPALQSYALATYEGMWILLGGMKIGFHGTSNNPPPFQSTYTNDSIWVIDPANATTYGIPVPKAYWNSLATDNAQYYQAGNDFYLCGGYTVSDPAQKRLNTTSGYFFKINIPNLISLVKSGGKTPALNEVFPIVIENDFFKVSGGELMVVNDHYYLIGGQDYEGVYTLGGSGKYTNAIRSFTLVQNQSGWSPANMNSLIDSVNLHRRDFNLAPYITSDGSMEAIIYGGVFTPKDLSYVNPVYISGLSDGTPAIRVGGTEQQCNQYTCPVIPFYLSPGLPMLYGLIGGISYMKYDPNSNGLVIGDNGIPMPFSNLMDFIITDGDSSVEFVQIPPLPLLPGYLGSNALFIPLPQFASDDYPNLLDLDKIFSVSYVNLKIGYMCGGILSDGPTSGTTAKGHVNTYANPVLYSVNFTLDLSKIQDKQVK